MFTGLHWRVFAGLREWGPESGAQKNHGIHILSAQGARYLTERQRFILLLHQLYYPSSLISLLRRRVEFTLIFLL